MSGFNFFWNLFPKKEAECICCETTFPKEAMKEIWFQYTEEDSKTGTSSVFACEKCLSDIATNTEALMAELEAFDHDEPL